MPMSTTSSDQNFEINEIVWAKVQGYPWWPAQIASIRQMNGKNGQYCEFRVNFIGDTSHADLRLDKVKKWDQKPQQLESKKLRASIDLALNIIAGKGKLSIVNLENLNDHALKNLIIQLDCQMLTLGSAEDISETLNNISNNELLAIVKMYLGQQLFQLHQIVKQGKLNEIIKQTQLFVDKMIAIVGFKEQNEILSTEKRLEKPTPNSEDTNQITDSPIKKKKIEDISQDPLFNQH